MRRLWLIIALVALGGCATVYEDRYGYYSDPGYGGDYYYDREPVGYVAMDYGYGYSAYDSVFWGLQHSYLDPFWYPGFHYGVTYFPSYYGWSSWYAGDYWRWRNFHPYSPYYGSYWDHYYAWNPRRGYRHGGFRHDNGGDPQRYGSARNAAERMARSGRVDTAASRRSAWMAGDGSMAPRNSAYDRGLGASRQGGSSRAASGWQGEALRSRSYAPDSRRSPGLIGSRGEDGFIRDRAGRGLDTRILEGGRFENRRFERSTVAPGGRETSAIRSGYPGMEGSRGTAPNVRTMPQFDQRMRAPAPREFREGAPARSFDSQPSMRSGGEGRGMRSPGRSSEGRGGSRGRAER